MKTYKYKAVPEVALEFYRENGMEVKFDPELFNGVLTIHAASEELADHIRSTITDMRMWEKIEASTEECCEQCGATGEGTSAWGGWCHDCDNHLEDPSLAS